ncbi:MAG: GatB/YqeY domain-containing protein, partial [Chloroflexi bacterium]|nr:GatB/YqeY domain-containing protein [Chloroflexota bacterium]
MGGVRDQLRSDLRDAMRAKDVPRRNTIRMVEAAIKNAEIEKRGTELAESDILAILQRQVKQRRESIEQFTQGGREDLAENERVEIAIIEAYLPQQLSRDEVELRARSVIAQVGAAGPGDRGKG